MGLFSSISKFIAPAATAVGTFFGGPVGGAIGSALGSVASGAISSGIEGAPAYFSAKATNALNQQMSQQTNAFNAQQAVLGRNFSAKQSSLAWERSKEGARNANSFTRAQAQRQMDFQAEQSGSVYQRGMVDMKKAGLNPILAFSQGGAPAASGAGGSGAQASATPGSSSTASGVQIPKIDEVAAGINSAINIGQFKLARASATQEVSRSKSQQKNENRQTDANIKLTKEQTRIAKEDADKKAGYGDSVIGNNIQSIMRMLRTLGEHVPSARRSSEQKGYIKKFNFPGKRNTGTHIELNTPRGN